MVDRLEIFQDGQQGDEALEQGYDFHDLLLPPPTAFVRCKKAAKPAFPDILNDDFYTLKAKPVKPHHSIRAAIGKELCTEKTKYCQDRKIAAQTLWDQLLDD